MSSTQGRGPGPLRSASSTQPEHPPSASIAKLNSGIGAPSPRSGEFNSGDRGVGGRIGELNLDWGGGGGAAVSSTQDLGSGHLRTPLAQQFGSESLPNLRSGVPQRATGGILVVIATPHRLSAVSIAKWNEGDVVMPSPKEVRAIVGSIHSRSTPPRMTAHLLTSCPHTLIGEHGEHNGGHVGGDTA